MKTTLIALGVALVAGGCSKESGAVRTLSPYGEEIEFRVHPAFEDTTRIWLARFPSGEIVCISSKVPLFPGDDGIKRAHILTERKISLDDYEKFARALEDPTLRSAAESGDGAAIDGVCWVFRKSSGGRSLELRFGNPQQEFVLSLGERFASIADLNDLIQK